MLAIPRFFYWLFVQCACALEYFCLRMHVMSVRAPCLCMQMYACAHRHGLSCQCVSCNCFNVTKKLFAPVPTVCVDPRSKRFSTSEHCFLRVLCKHYMYAHMARCHACACIWVDACLYKLFRYNLSCLHRLVHVSLSVRKALQLDFSKENVTNW